MKNIELTPEEAAFAGLLCALGAQVLACPGEKPSQDIIVLIRRLESKVVCARDTLLDKLDPDKVYPPVMHLLRPPYSAGGKN